MFRGPFRYLPIGAPHYRSEAENSAARRSRTRQWNRRRKKEHHYGWIASTSIAWTRPFRRYVPLRSIYDSRRQNYSYRLVSIDPDAERSVYVSTWGSAASVSGFFFPLAGRGVPWTVVCICPLKFRERRYSLFLKLALSLSLALGGCTVIRSLNGRTRLYLQALSRFLEREESCIGRIPTRFSLPHHGTWSNVME